MLLFEIVTDFDTGRDLLRRRRYGIIETGGGRLEAIHLRPWAKLASKRDLWPFGERYHVRGAPDHCWLYYNQPMRFNNFLSLKYIVSSAATRYVTFLAALRVLDAIAQLKRSDAILCDVANSRISDRLLTRLGWESHKPQRWHRNYIKRFYGEYPKIELAPIIQNPDSG
ncbi:MAG: hypothetical protein JW829_04545 [Pirellulales bacterium]|nr:hypothetical protein [Pirellulales bacterium]